MKGLSSAFSPTRRAARPAAHLAAALCALAAGLIVLGGCRSSPQATSSVSAADAVALAARNADRISSLTMTASITMRDRSAAGGGIGLPAAGVARIAVRERMQLKPRLLEASTTQVHVAGHVLSASMILTARALYVTAMPETAARPWTKTSLSALPNGSSLRRLLRRTQSAGPLGELGNPRSLTRLLAGARRLRVVRGQVVDGAATTEYSGVLSLRQIMALVPAADRSILGTLPAGLRVTGPFRVWIDGQQHVRMIQLRFSYLKVSMAVLVNITSVNRPVRITAPPASRVSATVRP